MKDKVQVCKRCVMPTSIPDVKLDSDGICNFCHQHDQMEKEYPIEERLWNNLITRLKNHNNRYDVVVGFSGGCDSSYLLWKLHQAGLNCLAVHWDNTWNSPTAWDNIMRVVNGLHVDFMRMTIDDEVYNDICKSFLYSSTPDADIPNDIALTSVLYQIADKFDVGWIANGHSFRTEGMCPTCWTYMDGQYIKSVQQQFGVADWKRFPNLLIDDWLRWLEKPIRRCRPLYHLPFNKAEVKQELKDEFGWVWYGSHHAENIYTKFVGNYLWPRKFDIDLRVVEFSALIRSGQMDRETALNELDKEPLFEQEYLEMVIRRLHLSHGEIEFILSQPPKSYREYGTYTQYFKEQQPRFKKLLEQELIPYTFYHKYVEGV